MLISLTLSFFIFLYSTATKKEDAQYVATVQCVDKIVLRSDMVDNARQLLGEPTIYTSLIQEKEFIISSWFF